VLSSLTVLTLASVTDDWRITEHSPNVALQLANQWAIAVNAQARRIQNPENSQERIPDAYIQVLALRNLLRAAELAKKTVPQDQADKTLEDLAQDYRIDFEPPADRPQLRVGPVRPAEALFTIDLVTTASQAARQLVDAVHAAIVQDQTPNANG
jgi:hypothetical protein